MFKTFKCLKLLSNERNFNFQSETSCSYKTPVVIQNNPKTFKIFKSPASPNKNLFLSPYNFCN